ncbi:MAG: PorT family protein [Flavobacteriaceae bacterium]|nr:PorT family protein [Flavobacteriaceae bacterium]
MSKLLITIVTITLLSVNTNAQKAVFGVKAGLNFSKFGADVDRDGRTSLFIGAVADIAINDKIHIQPELMFSGEGSEDLEANFIRAFGIGKYYVADGFSLESGPYIGIRISGDELVENNTKSFDFGLSFGVGYEIEDLGLFFNTRFNLGIANLGEGNLDTNLGTFQMGVGYKFY